MPPLHRQVMGWIPAPKSILAQFSLRTWLECLSREIRGRGELGIAAAVRPALLRTQDAGNKSRCFFTLEFLQVGNPTHSLPAVQHGVLFAGPQAFPSGQWCLLVLLLALLKSHKELFFCSSGKSSLHDNSWGVSISFCTHALAFLYLKPLEEDPGSAGSSTCSPTTPSAQPKSDHKPSPTTPIAVEGILIKFSDERKKQIGFKSSQALL